MLIFVFALIYAYIPRETEQGMIKTIIDNGIVFMNSELIVKELYSMPEHTLISTYEKIVVSMIHNARTMKRVEQIKNNMERIESKELRFNKIREALYKRQIKFIISKVAPEVSLSKFDRIDNNYDLKSRFEEVIVLAINKMPSMEQVKELEDILNDATIVATSSYTINSVLKKKAKQFGGSLDDRPFKMNPNLKEKIDIGQEISIDSLKRNLQMIDDLINDIQGKALNKLVFEKVKNEFDFLSGVLNDKVNRFQDNFLKMIKNAKHFSELNALIHKIVDTERFISFEGGHKSNVFRNAIKTTLQKSKNAKAIKLYNSLQKVDALKIHT